MLLLRAKNFVRAHTEEKRCDRYSDGSANGHYDCCSLRVKVAVVDGGRRTVNDVETGMLGLACSNAQKGNVTHATTFSEEQVRYFVNHHSATVNQSQNERSIDDCLRSYHAISRQKHKRDHFPCL